MDYFNKRKIDSRTATVSQLAYARESTLDNGPSKGIKVIDINNGTGLHCTVQIDRGMDLGRCSYKGVPVSFITPPGITHPAYFNSYGMNWLRTWGGGLMTGSGLRNAGTPQQSDNPDDPLGLHGRLSHTPGRLQAIEEGWEGEDYVIKVKGSVRESSFFGENLLLERTIEVKSISNTITINDSVTNEGPRKSPFMLLYHFNFGYPLLDDGTRIECDTLSLEPRDKTAERHMKDWTTMSSPADGFIERCYYPDIREKEGRCSLSIHNHTLPFYTLLDWDKKNLPFTTVWKMLGVKEYVLGIEPMNCHPEGQKAERERGTLVELEPGEQKSMNLKLSFIDN